MNNYKVSIANTSTANLTSGNFISGLTQVFGPVNYTSVVGDNAFPFTTPFIWDGTSNLVVQICHDYTCTGSAAVQMQFLNDYTIADQSGSGCGSASGDAYSGARPVIKFNFSGLDTSTITYAWSPAASLDNSTNATPVATPAATTTYTVTATDPASGCALSEDVTVNVTDLPAFSVCPANQSAPGCTGAGTQTYTATANAPITYTFSGATTGNGSGTGSGETFNNGITTVTLTAANGCSPDAICTFTVTQGDITAPVITACNPAITLDPNGCNCYPMLATIASPVTINSIDRYITYSNVSINQGGNAAQVLPGATVALAYNMNVAFNGSTGYCPGCVVQSYVGIGGTNTTIQCENSIYDGYAASRNVTFTAPATPGYYYLTQNATLEFSCIPGLGYSSSTSFAIGVIQVGSSYAGLDVASSDNCGPVTVTNDAPACFPIGTTTVTYTVTDAGGNSSTCTQDVTATQYNTTIAIATQPQATAGCEAQPLSLTVAAPAASAYQWYHDNTAIPGATFATYSIASATLADDGQYYVEATSVSCGSVISNTVAVTVHPNPVVSIAATATSLCPSGPASSTTLTASGADTYEWNPGGSMMNPETFSPSATTTYTLIGTEAVYGCSNTASITINVGPTLTLSPIASPDSICAGGSSQLDAGFTSTGGTGGGTSYNGSVIPYAPLATPGGAVTLATLGAYVVPTNYGYLDDDFWTVTLPFTFTYYGNSYSTIYVGTNGHLDFQAYGADNIPGYDPLPDYFIENAILPLGADIDLRDGGTVEYFTTGTAPNRKFVVNYTNVHFYNDNGLGTVQAVLLEADHSIEFHTTNFNGNIYDLAVQGIQNEDASVAVVVPGRNSVLSFGGTPDGYRFATLQPANFAWTPAASLDDATSSTPIATPAATTTYTVTATDPSSGCAISQTITVKVNPTNTWTGAVSTDWNDNGNWCGNVPTVSSDIAIPSPLVVPNNPHVYTGNSGSVNNINLLDGVLTIDNGGSLNLFGNVMQMPGGTFDATGGTVNFDGSASQTILPGFTASNMNVDGGSVKSMTGGVAITNALTFINGMVDVGNSVLSISPSGTISGAGPGSYVRTSAPGGRLQQQVGAAPVAFPVGNSSYNPATLSNSGTTDNFAVSVRDEVLDGGTSGGPINAASTYAINRTWDVEESTAGGSDAEMTLQWNSGEENSPLFDYSHVYISHWTGTTYDNPYTSAANAPAAMGTDPTP